MTSGATFDIPFWGANTIMVTLGCAVFGALAGSVGTFVLARKQSLLADVAGHAALPGVALAFLMGEWLEINGRSPWLLFLGGGTTAWLAAWCTPWLANKRRLGADGANAVALAGFFGLGTVLFSLVQSHPTGAQGGLRKLLFGNAAAITSSDAFALASIALIALLVLVLYFKEFSLLAFDEAAAKVLGFPTRILDWMLLLLLVATVVAGMQVAGVALVVSMLIAPAAAARVIGGSFAKTATLAACIGVACAVTGAIASRAIDHVPTGSAMTLAATGAFFLSIPVARFFHSKREHVAKELAV
ncbi:MAG: metal ABC transporter permease [Phycisphaerales bacterium]|nr:metal ABC transporter permease [Phycisphaerales bacterium]